MPRRRPLPAAQLILATVALLLAGLLGAPAATANPATAELPGGKERFAVAVGGLAAGSTTNWVRLGTYELAADGTVTEDHWHWTQRRRETRSSTGVEAAGCPTRSCVVRTAHGYQSTGAPQSLSGSYTLDAGLLRITWDGGQGWEEWRVAEAADGALATLDFERSSFGATHGFGYGSNAAWSARASAATVAAADHAAFDHDYFLWKVSAENTSPHIDTGSGSPFWMRDWSVCGSGRCLAGRTASATDYYVTPANTATNHRRDTLWHWRTSLADGRGEHCYTGNSHVKPMIQIIDDEGTFHGWVGVEASLNQTVPSEGVYGDDIGVFRIAAH
ncbi:hypothetical protein [Streptomyces profundus]|uniref:hypothetical protein n=1 Tax=Streptomyces profundus TaxID=2867410 RepID=UPI001D16A86B|nr:hypothetical protein [Streptomyces sp. MA3_2.13]UED84151.1 hypothetical protein K4G22_07960 [Streptomyces sp. MA3_2.13]